MNAFSIREAAAEHPTREALFVEGRRISYADLSIHVREAANWLCGQLPRTLELPVALTVTPTLGGIALVLAGFELGIPWLLLHERYTDAERARTLAALPHAAHVDSSTYEADGAGTGREWPTAHLGNLDPEAPLALVLTSGTTGTPKAVELSRRAFLASADASAENLGWRDDDRWLLCLPLAHVGGLSILTRCLLARSSVVLPGPSSSGWTAERLAQVFAATRTTQVSLVPTLLTRLLQLPDYALPAHMRTLLIGGAAASAPLLEQVSARGWPVLTTYGLSETCAQLCTQPYSERGRGSADAGRPLGDMEVRVRDGVIEARGASLFTGYYPRAPGTAARAPDAWFTTRDMGHLDARGRLHVFGRREEMILCGGENVFPAEVNAVIETCAGVVGACVFGVPDDEWGERVAVALEVAPNFDPVAFARAVREKLARFKRPRLIAIVPRLVRTPSGKLDQRANVAQCVHRLEPMSTE